MKTSIRLDPEAERLLSGGRVIPDRQLPGSSDLLACVEQFIRRFAVLPERAFLPISAWIAATYLAGSFDAFPYIALISPTKRCGKTRLLELFELLSKSPWRGTAPSPAALYRMMAERPTLLLDEVENLNSKHASETQQAILAILNAGHRKGETIPRCDGPKHELKHFAVYGPKAFAAIAKLPETLMDRSIVIHMQRRRSDQPIERMLYANAKADAGPIAALLAHFGDTRIDAIRAAYERLMMKDLHFLGDRDADLWIPLFAVCSVAAPDRITELQDCARDLSGTKTADDQDDSLPLKLLSDVQGIWPADEEQIATAVLLERLNKLEESPWSEFQLSPRKLARMLKPFGVTPIQYRNGAEGGLRGYSRASFEFSFSRYLHFPSATSATTSEAKDL